MRNMTYDLTKLRKLGERRAAALAELEAVRKEVEAELGPARKEHITWREIASSTHYTENRLQRMWAEREG